MAHCFPWFWKEMAEIDDPREERHYTITQVLMLGVLMFACRIRSLRALDAVSDDPLFLDNWCRLSRARTDTVICSRQMTNVLAQLDPDELAEIPVKMIKALVRQKQIPDAFILGHLAVASDATGIFSSSKRHCQNCLTQTHKDGTVTYMHNMLEAKVICANRMALSLMSESIENPQDDDYDKQDCESKAFKRLIPRIKHSLPRQPLVHLLDALYANAPTFHLIENNKQKFICCFKPGSIPTLYQEALELLKLTPQNTCKETIGPHNNGVERRYAWTQVEYDTLTLCFVMCKETKTNTGQSTTFAWLTNFTATRDTVQEIARGGRMRWKIENEGFNEQKTGYEMEHFCDCSDPNLMHCLYLLLQIAHMLMQLLAKSDLVDARPTLTFLAYLLLEALRNTVLPDPLFTPNLPRIQIRFAKPADP